MMDIKNKIRWFILVGFVAGMTEIVWVSLYSLFSHVELANIASSISQTVFFNSLNIQIAPVMGIIVHLGLSILLALAFGFTVLPFIERQTTNSTTLIASLITLTVVWKINFFVLLPVWNPEFISLLPLHITLVSKLLFGLTMGMMLTQQKRLKT